MKEILKRERYGFLEIPSLPPAIEIEKIILVRH